MDEIRHVFFISIFLFIFPFLGKAQKNNSDHPWSKYIISSSDQNNKQLVSDFYLTEYSEAQNHSAITIIRKLDNTYAIVKIKPLSHWDKKKWKVNNHWKVNNQYSSLPESELTTFYIRTLDNKASTVASGSSLNLTYLNKHTLKVQCTKKQVEDFLANKEVVSISVESQSPTVDSRVIDLNLNVNTVNLIHNKFPLLNGDDIVLSIQEQMYQLDDIDIIGRDLPSDLSSDEVDNHATDMATIAAGAGNTFITGRGVAKNTSITSSDFADVLPDQQSDYEALGVSVQNHSYGTRIENFYGVQAEAFDQSANDNDKLLHIISSGNLGLSQDTTGTYKGVEGYANLSGNFKMAKNILTVGSVDTVGRNITFTSVGPAYDGRIKPELVTYSTAGSSNSAALVSGVAVLLQQAYLDQMGSLPEASLIKSLLINSANDVHTTGIDFISGYGNVDAEKTLQNLLNQKYFSGSISQGETVDFNITVPSNAKNLKVTIVWNDPAATANSNIALVNDLDMTLSNGADSWLPWVLDSSPNAELLAKAPVRGEDHLNNVEQISVDEPLNGTYTISVQGNAISNGSQSYTIAYDWEVTDQFEWTYPTSTDNMPYDGETGSYFRWRSTLANTTGTLQYSTDEGANWQNISTDVNLNQGFYRWQPPEINSSAIARIVTGGNSYLTDEFSISRPTRMSVGFNCADSVMLQWNQIAEASSYEIFTLGEKYLEKVVTTNDSVIVISKGQFPSKYWAVKPLGLNGKEFIESFTINYDLQGVDCYLISFFPEITEDNKFFLNIELGTTYGVEEIIIQRLENEEFVNAYSVTPTANNIRVEEVDPFQGPNTHRAIIKFGNGEELVSQESFIYFLSEKPFLVFPNPVEPGDEVIVFSKIFESGTKVVFSLYNREGQKVLEEELVSNREFLDTSYLESGLYIYKAVAGKEVSTGRLVIMGD